MKVILACAFCIFVCGNNIQAQINYRITSHNTTGEAFKYLLLSNSAIEANDTINEKILDLVNPTVLDSVIDRKIEHHQVFLVGWFIHAFGGYNWRAVSNVKQKFVGTVSADSRTGGEEYTEYDIKYDLNFHLDKYLNQALYCYDCQRKLKRQDIRKSHHTDYNKVPFVRDPANLEISRYRIHCEMTPARAFRPQLHYLFFPTLPGISQREHPNIGSDHPSMGAYGVSCLDCNHNCHPELHPYEWLWWMNLHTGDEQAKTWLIGLFYESSNRFRHWSHNPKTGTTNIPFAFVINGQAPTSPKIIIEHLVFNTFVDSNLSKLHLPDTLISTRQQKQTIHVTDGRGSLFTIDLEFLSAIPTNGLKYWLSDLNWDAQQHILSGYLNMGLSVKDLYTARVTFKP